MKNSSFRYFLFVIGINGILGNLIGYFLPIYFKELGFSGFETGLYFSVSTIATILLSLPMGVSTDRKSIAFILMISFLFMGISKIGLIISTSFLVFCVFAFIGSFGGRFYGTAVNSLFFKMGGINNRKEAGLFQLVSFVCAGIGMLIGAFVIAGFSFRAVFIFGFITNWILMALCYFLPRNETVVIKMDEYKKAVLNPRVLFVTAIFSLSSFHWGAETVSYGPFLKDVLGLSITQTGLYTSFGIIIVGIGAYGGVVLLDRKWIKNLNVLMLLGFFMAGAGHILMCVHNVPLSFAFRLIHEIGDVFAFLVYYHGITKLFHLDKIGGCSAFISLCMSISSFLSSMLFGYLGDVLGYQWPLIISGIVLLCIPVLLMLQNRQIMEQDTAPSST
jgi:MFS family permease